MIFRRSSCSGFIFSYPFSLTHAIVHPENILGEWYSARKARLQNLFSLRAAGPPKLAREEKPPEIREATINHLLASCKQIKPLC